jgi:hypothetical protein
MYGIESSVLHVYLHDVDIILYINNIDNPLSIKEGMLLRYPPMEIWINLDIRQQIQHLVLYN